MCYDGHMKVEIQKERRKINMYKNINEFIQNEFGKTKDFMSYRESIKNTIIQAYDLGVQHGRGTLGNIVSPTLEESKKE